METNDKQQIADSIRAKVSELESLIAKAESMGLTVKLSGRTMYNGVFRPESPLSVEVTYYQMQKY